MPVFTAPTAEATLSPPPITPEEVRSAGLDYADAFRAERHLAAQYDVSSRRMRDFLSEPLKRTRGITTEALKDFLGCLATLEVDEPEAALRIVEELRERTKDARLDAAEAAAATSAAVFVVTGMGG